MQSLCHTCGNFEKYICAPCCAGISLFPSKMTHFHTLLFSAIKTKNALLECKLTPNGFINIILHPKKKCVYMAIRRTQCAYTQQ